MSKPRLEVTTGEISQIVAISQGAINDALYYLFDQHEELRTITVTSTLAGKLDAQMDAAEVFLPVRDTGKFYTVVFFCMFKSGSLWLAEGNFHPTEDDFISINEDSGLENGGKNEKLQGPINVTGWKFAFEVDFHKLDVPQGDEHDKVVKRLNQPGDYSIKRLFIDFSTNKISNFRKDLCDYKGYEWKTEEDELKLAFIMANWGSVKKGVMKDPKLSTIGYAIETQNPKTVNPVAPTFPPTALRHQIYKYIAPGDKEPKEGLVDGKYNTLLYVEMTQKIPFPSDTPFAYTGNFIEPPGMKATVCISRQVFWDSYLLRDPSDLPCLFQEFNRCAYAWHNKLNASQSKVTWNFGFGEGGSHELPNDWFRWVRTSPTTWTWTYSNPNEESHAGSGWTWYVNGYGTGETSNTLTLRPGSNSFSVSGSSWLKLESNVKNYLGITWWESSQKVTITWSTEVRLKSVHNGGLEMTMHPSEPSKIFHVSSNVSNSRGSDYKDFEPPKLPGLPPAWEKAVKAIKFERMTVSLTSALNTTSKFVLSGGDELFYKDPIFSNNGDVLVEAELKNK